MDIEKKRKWQALMKGVGGILGFAGSNGLSLTESSKIVTKRGLIEARVSPQLRALTLRLLFLSELGLSHRRGYHTFSSFNININIPTFNYTRDFFFFQNIFFFIRTHRTLFFKRTCLI